ncbi:class I SAM-dependent DNA methyltransferase [Agrobacterium tumefaciens]|uniref:class I SAM-dependent DNA methyltransferase n=1 Tax=Agrobacterium tumefaciens TaxID=358 RepID=UPI00045A74AF|nr:class I SAM-dependent methyltransferase [Agrobacterium tumefaciens]CDN91463.1 Methyltransferase [Agrobacterium tumefaciens]
MSDASNDVIRLYNEHGADFDSQRGRSLAEKPWLDRFTSLLPQGASILDIGCGSGEPIAGYLIGNGYDVTGIDSSLPLIELCRVRFPEKLWAVADMRKLALGRRFDGLIAWHSFFHLKAEDQRRMFGIFGQHANDGAALMFTAGPGEGQAIGTFQGKPLYHASLAREEYESLLAAHGFRLLDHVVEDPDCGGATIYLARRVAA